MVSSPKLIWSVSFVVPLSNTDTDTQCKQDPVASQCVEWEDQIQLSLLINKGKL